jgi:hypothetical protein
MPSLDIMGACGRLWLFADGQLSKDLYSGLFLK